MSKLKVKNVLFDVFILTSNQMYQRQKIKNKNI